MWICPNKNCPYRLLNLMPYSEDFPSVCKYCGSVLRRQLAPAYCIKSSRENKVTFTNSKSHNESTKLMEGEYDEETWK